MKKTNNHPVLHQIQEPKEGSSGSVEGNEQPIQSLINLPKVVDRHPHRSVYEWFMCHSNERSLAKETLLSAFDHALKSKGKIQKGILLGSPEHAAALAGAATWRAANPSPRKGGPGRGQGRKASDGYTNFIRMSVNLLPEQHEPFKKLGGSAWLRAQICAQPQTD